MESIEEKRVVIIIFIIIAGILTILFNSRFFSIYQNESISNLNFKNIYFNAGKTLILSFNQFDHTYKLNYNKIDYAIEGNYFLNSENEIGTLTDGFDNDDVFAKFKFDGSQVHIVTYKYYIDLDDNIDELTTLYSDLVTSCENYTYIKIDSLVKGEFKILLENSPEFNNISSDTIFIDSKCSVSSYIMSLIDSKCIKFLNSANVEIPYCPDGSCVINSRCIFKYGFNQRSRNSLDCFSDSDKNVFFIDVK